MATALQRASNHQFDGATGNTSARAPSGPPSVSSRGSFSMLVDKEGVPLLGGGIGGRSDGQHTPKSPKTNRRHAVYALLSMLLLTLQGTVLSIILRYSRIKRGRKYIPSVAGKSHYRYSCSSILLPPNFPF